MSVEKYLRTSYDPDMEYADSSLVVRPVGGRQHSRILGLILNLLMSSEDRYRILAYPELRIQVAENEFRIPDVCAMSADHKREEVFTEPPLLIFEVVSPDSFLSLIAKARQYRSVGVRNVCVVDPYNRAVFVVDEKGRLGESETLVVAMRVRDDQPALVFDFAQWFDQL